MVRSQLQTTWRCSTWLEAITMDPIHPSKICPRIPKAILVNKLWTLMDHVSKNMASILISLSTKSKLFRIMVKICLTLSLCKLQHWSTCRNTNSSWNKMIKKAIMGRRMPIRTSEVSSCPTSQWVKQLKNSHLLSVRLSKFLRASTMKSKFYFKQVLICNTKNSTSNTSMMPF